jgi:hypothetical protein
MRTNIILETGDITTIKAGFIFHGVNCRGAMGSGVAKTLSDKWPIVKEEYRKLHGRFQYKEDELLGVYQIVPIDKQISVVNAFTQYNFGSGGRFASPMAIDWSLRHFCAKLINTCDPESRHIHLPKIGGDRGGLDFEKEVMPIIERCAMLYPTITFIVWTYDGTLNK